MTLAERAKQLRAAQEKLPELLSNAAKNATIRAVEKATELTPPLEGELKGVNTQTGMMKARWEWDSSTEPMGFASGEYVTVLRNNARYASYVNDGHRMDQHFVHGLYVDNGMLNYDPSAKVGLVVGTKTKYVKGLFMTDPAKEEYRRVLEEELKKAEELLK